MRHSFLAAADLFFFALHTVLILFNVLGWIPRKWRKWNLLTLLLTLASWTVMGLWFGRGYCVLTDWHWKVRAAMGIQETADSYLVLLVRTLTGWDPPVALVNAVAFWTFLVSLTASLALNALDARNRARVTAGQTPLLADASLYERSVHCDGGVE